MPLISQREYARRRGITSNAVRRRLQSAGGPIPTHGRSRQIDPDEADRIWMATMSPSAMSQSRFQEPPGTAPATEAPGGLAGAFGKMEALAQARTAVLLTEAQLKRLRLEERRGQLLDRQATLAKFFQVVRAMRDAWLAWPARVGPELAADLDLDASKVMIALEPYVRRQLDELASVKLDLGRRPGS